MRPFFIVIVFLGYICRVGTVKAIKDPRDEYHAKITSGERAYLKSLREAKVSQDEGTLQTNHTPPMTLPTPDVPKELIQLSSMQGISPNENGAKVDQTEFQRTKMKAEEGSADAAYFMGLFHLYGLGSFIEPNEEIAAKWFRLSAKEGHNDARCALGLLLYYGIGNIEKDTAAATSYFRFASNDGHSFGHWMYAKSMYEMASADDNPSGNTKEQFQEAARLFQMAAHDIPEASHQLAVMYEYGLLKSERSNIEEPDFNKAAELYQIASRRGCVESTYHLALMHNYGRGFPQDYSQAAELFQIAATHPMTPHPPSMRYLAIILANGFSDANEIPDFDGALHFYDQCAQQSRSVDVQKICKTERDALANLVHGSRGRALETYNDNKVD